MNFSSTFPPTDKLPPITQISIILSSNLNNIKTPEQAYVLLDKLYRLLCFQSRREQITEDGAEVDLTGLMLNYLPIRQMAGERSLLQLIRILDNQSNVKTSFRSCFSPEQFEIDENIFENLASLMENHYDETNIFSEKTLISSENKKKRTELCQKNIRFLMNKCVHSPYLYALTPLYIFLIYRNAKGCFFTRDFEAEATNAKYDKNFIYPLLKHVKDRFPYKTKKDRLTAEKDINLMGSIMSTIGAIVPSTFFSYNDSELTDESIPNPFEIMPIHKHLRLRLHICLPLIGGIFFVFFFNES